VNRKAYFEEHVNIIAQNRKLRFIVFLMAVAVIINGFFVYSAGIHQKIVLVPPYIEGEAYVYGNNAGDSYLKSMAVYVCSLRLNYTPANVKRQFGAFLRLLPPETFKSYQVELYKLKDKVLSLRVSSAFFPFKTEVNRKRKIIFVSGRLDQWTYDKEFITSEERTYGVKYAVENGRFYVVNFLYCGKNKEGCISREEQRGVEK